MSVDIFIPHWGAPELLRQAVQSVLDQTLDQWSLTIIDDATPGPAGEATTEYFAELNSLGDARIRTVVKAKNEGITANFRTCADAATAPLVTIMGNDDRLLPDYVATVVEAFSNHPDAHVIQPAVSVIDASGAEFTTLVDAVKQLVLRPNSSSPTLLSGDKLGASLMHGNWLYWPSLCFTREILQSHQFRSEFAVIQDLALLLDMFLDGANLLVLPKRAKGVPASFEYRRHDESASAVALLDGSRFAGERDFYQLAARLASERHWRRTQLAARLHLTSRAHALTLLPKAIVSRRRGAARRMVRHAFGP